eukprot:TRINITY_DN5931_c0_g1_i1.p1 TRINITY_DN5931_c0_g1~~TRINITY_DN5931_c0_g1_i1.p1  ORF type:complete len:305 (+),score=46.96 TRINITY_DN5931_c0_g1_i1:109-915(+)
MMSVKILRSWIKDVAKHMKKVAPKQLAIAGMQGYFDEQNEDRLKDNPGAWATCQGQDFEVLNSVKYLDMTSVHIYPEHIKWDSVAQIECGNQCKLDWIRRALESQLEVSEKLNKPMMVGEFGYPDYDEDRFWVLMRNRVYQEVYNVTMTSMLNKGPAAGSLFWRGGVDGDIAWEWRMVYIDDAPRQPIPQPNETESDRALLEQIQADYRSFFNDEEASICQEEQYHKISTIITEQLRKMDPEPDLPSTAQIVFEAAETISKMYPHDDL